MALTRTPLDLEQFWRDNDVALRSPFDARNSRTPMGIGMGVFAMFAELGIEQDMRRVEDDPAWANGLIRQYNDIAERVVGRRLISERDEEPLDHQPPHVPGVGELCGCKRIWQDQSWWLLEAAHNVDELKTLLDRIDALDIEDAMFGGDFEKRSRDAFERTGRRPRFNMSLRGPVTLATSIFGVENLIYLLMDDPPLADRFRDTLSRVIMTYYTLCFDRTDPDHRRAGFAFYDDNCAMLTPEMYARFGQPLLQAVYDRFAPNPDDLRYQHSDSDMGHLLTLLAETGMNRVNFGPNVRFAQIRAAMPNAIVEGTLAPFTFLRNETDKIIAEVERDLDESRATRGLVVATAGSVNDGTRLTSLRTIMETIWADRPPVVKIN